VSEIVNGALEVIKTKLDGNGLDGSIKIDISGEGAIRIEGETAEISDADADCTMTADADTFKGIIDGEVNPTTAFMTGKLSVDGEMGVAMKLAGILG